MSKDQMDSHRDIAESASSVAQSSDIEPKLLDSTRDANHQRAHKRSPDHRRDQRRKRREGRAQRGGKRQPPMVAHGVLLIDKPKGLSSFDVIRELRRATGVKKMGHTGTLDPMATGLLVICMGEATKLVSYLTADDKSYEAEVTFGVVTNTYDAEGEVIHKASDDQLLELSQDQVTDTLMDFIGEQLQRPPAFSAIKVNGQRLYERARRGEAVEVPPRAVTFHQLELMSWSSKENVNQELGPEYSPEPSSSSATSTLTQNLPRAEVNIMCSKGTYIRSLAFDLGEELGCGAHLSALRRTRAGHFSLTEAHELKSINSESLAHALTPLVDALPQAPKVTLSAAEVIAIRQGKVLSAPSLDPSEVGVYRGISEEGHLIALLKLEGDVLRVARGFKE